MKRTTPFAMALAVLTGLLPVGARSVPPEAPTISVDDTNRVARVAFRLASRGAALCQVKMPLTGLMLHHLTQYPPADRALVVRRFRLDQGAGIMAVADDSPAARAGLRAGDVLISVRGMPTRDLSDGSTRDGLARARAIERSLEERWQGGDVPVTIGRGRMVLTVSLRPEQGCPLRTRISNTPSVNAYADGTFVQVSGKLLGAVRSDDEVAVILAHELAHNVLRHTDMVGTDGSSDGAAGQMSISVLRTYEAEADRLSIGFLRAAGYNLSAAPPLWARLSKNGKRPRVHPRLKDRVKFWNQAVAASR